MPTTRKSRSDFTGRENERLASENHEELAKRADELAMIQELDLVALETEIDYTQGPAKAAEVEDITIDMELEAEELEETVYVIEDIDQMTFGAGNHYDFKAGQRYRVSKLMANHLREKGVLWVGGPGGRY